MTALRPVAGVVIRPAAEEDAGALSKFRCSTGGWWYEQDVERFVCRQALEQALASRGAYRLLLVFDGSRLVCCMAHHAEALVRGEGDSIFSTRLHLVAIAVEDQGRRLNDGTRLSDRLGATLIADALATNGFSVLTAIVALDNLRSMAMCERHGLRSQVQYDAQHARLSGHFRSPQGAPLIHAPPADERPRSRTNR